MEVVHTIFGQTRDIELPEVKALKKQMGVAGPLT